MKKKIDNIISEIFLIKLEEISDDLTADDIDGWDSLSHMQLISEVEKKAIETASANLRNTLKGTDTEEIKKKTQELVQAILFNIANPSTSFLPSYF